MPDLRVIRRAALRPRTALAIVAGALVVAAMVLANQPRGGSGPAPARARAAAATPLPTAPPTAMPGSTMRLLRERVAFSDRSAGRPPAPRLLADAGILVDIDSRTILWQRSPHQPHLAASTIKVLTSLVALENFPPDRLVTVTQDALDQAPDETRMGLLAGQQLTVGELLTGMLTVSANDSAKALAVDTAGYDQFVGAMNLQLHALGLRDSHVVNPVGLDDPGQMISAYDLAAIALADIDHFDLFSRIVASAEIDLPASDLHPEFDLVNINRLKRNYPPAVGIKTGWTGDAGYCIIGMAIRDGHRLIGVLLGDPHMIGDEKALLDWGFTQEGLASTLATPRPSPSPSPSASPRPHKP